MNQDKLAYRHGLVAQRREQKENQKRRNRENILATVSPLRTSLKSAARFVLSVPKAALNGVLASPRLLCVWRYFFVFALSLFATQCLRFIETSTDSIVVIPQATFETMTAHMKPSLAGPLWGEADGKKAGVFRLRLVEDTLHAKSKEEFSKQDDSDFYTTLDYCLSSHRCQQAHLRTLDVFPFGWSESAAPARLALQSLHASLGSQPVRSLSPTAWDWVFFIFFFCPFSSLLFFIQRVGQRRQQVSIALLLGHERLVATLFRGIGIWMIFFFLLAAFVECWWPTVAFPLFLSLGTLIPATVCFFFSDAFRKYKDESVEKEARELIEKGRFSAERELLRRDLDQHSSKKPARVPVARTRARRL